MPALGWLVLMTPVLVEETVVKMVYLCFGVPNLSFAGFDCYLSFIEYPVLEKSVTLDFNSGTGFYLPNVPRPPTNSDGFGNKTFFLELGLWFISGRNDYPVLSILYIFSIFYIFSVIVALNGFVVGLMSYPELFFFNLVRSKPPPVIKSFLAFLYCSSLSFASYCYLRCFLRAYSALF